MKIIIIVTVCLLIAIGAFFYFYIPGAWIGGIDGISTESHVVIQQDTATKDSSGNFEHTYTDYTLTAEQIEMLKEFIHSSSFTRSLRGTLYHNTTNMESYNTYSIIIRDDNFIAIHDGISVGISWGYFSGFKQSGSGWIKINNTNWEDSIMQILAYSGSGDLGIPDDPKLSKMPDDFSFSLDFGTYGKCNINTYDNTFTKDLISAGSETIDFVIPPDIMEEIYNSFIEHKIFELPGDINEEVERIEGAIYRMQTPSERYSLTYTYNDKTGIVVCEDGGPWRDDTGPPESRNRLVAFIELITEYIYSTADYQGMSPAEGGYL